MSNIGLFGRQRELAQADAFLASLSERFGVLRLQGEAGVGKTTIWREIIRRARDRQFRVLSCQPAEAETRFALSGLADLIEPVESERYAALPPPQRHALEVALLSVEPVGSGPGPDLRALAAAVRSLLANLSAEGPLLVAIDDVQWLDPDTAAVLQFVLRRLTGTRTGWLTTAREPGLGWLAGDDRPAATESQAVIPLGPLPLPAIHQMLLDRAHTGPVASGPAPGVPVVGRQPAVRP
jgi:hypothetical protein